MKKKKKRGADPTRQDYIRILRDSGIEEHETEAGTAHSIFEEANHPDVEAYAVAAAVGLEDGFDAALQPYNIDHDKTLPPVDWSRNERTGGFHGRFSPEYWISGPQTNHSKQAQLDSPGVSGDESSARDDDDEDDDDDDEGDFEAIPGHALLSNGHDISEVDKRQRLHEMEMAEAAALAARKSSIGSADSLASGTGEDEERSSTEGQKERRRDSALF